MSDYRWRLVVVGAVISTLVGGSLFYGLGVFFGPIQQQFGWSFGLVSGAFAIQYVVMGVGALVFGWFFDRIHPAWLALTGVGLTAGSFAMLSFVGSPVALYLVFGAMGIGGAAATFLLFNSLIALWFERSLGLALALVQTGYAIGSLSAAGFVGVTTAVGWRSAALLIGAAIAVGGLPLCRTIRLPSALSADERVPGRPHVTGEVLSAPVLAALRTRAFWVILAVIALSSGITQAVYSHQIRAIASFGVAVSIAGWAAGVAGLVGLLGRYGFGLASERISSRSLFAIALLLQGAGTIALSQVNSELSLAPFVVLFGIGQSAIFLLSPIVQRDYFGTAAFGTIQGLLLGPSILLSAAGPLAVGFAVDAVGTYRPALLGTGLVGILLSGLVLFARRPAPAITPARSADDATFSRIQA